MNYQEINTRLDSLEKSIKELKELCSAYKVDDKFKIPINEEFNTQYQADYDEYYKSNK